MLLRGPARELLGFAAMHCGRDTEAGEGRALVKFAAVRPGDEEGFERLLDACEALAWSRGLRSVEAGTNLARDRAYRVLKRRGYRTFIQGVAMHRPNEAAYHRSDCFVIDDWR